MKFCSEEGTLFVVNLSSCMFETAPRGCTRNLSPNLLSGLQETAKITGQDDSRDSVLRQKRLVKRSIGRKRQKNLGRVSLSGS
jgi:hypothetical protein